MSKKVKVLVATLAVAGLLIVAFASTALAHDPADVDDTGQDWCEQPGWGHHHGHGVIYAETVSELLGLTPEEIQAERQEGKSLVEIAAAQGVSEDTLVAAILTAKKEAVQEKVDAGILTQEQADLMFQQMEQRTIEAVNRTTVGPPEDRGACGYGQAGVGPDTGMMGQWGRQDDGRSPYGGMGFGMGQGGMHGWGRGMH